MTVAAYVDAESVLKLWLNSRTATLVGAGNPLALGVHLRPLRSPAKGSYALLTRLGGYEDTGDAPIDYARMSFQVYSMTKEGAAFAATALANEIRQLDGTQQSVAGGKLLGYNTMTGPSYAPDFDEERYLVDVIVAITPAP